MLRLVFQLARSIPDLSVRYLPAESDSRVFSGNSNWRGPIWFPLNYLLIESLQKFRLYYGDNFKGRGVGAAHQTGWTGLVAKLLQSRLPIRN